MYKLFSCLITDTDKNECNNQLDRTLLEIILKTNIKDHYFSINTLRSLDNSFRIN